MRPGGVDVTGLCSLQPAGRRASWLLMLRDGLVDRRCAAHHAANPRGAGCRNSQELTPSAVAPLLLAKFQANTAGQAVSKPTPRRRRAPSYMKMLSSSKAGRNQTRSQARSEIKANHLSRSIEKCLQATKQSRLVHTRDDRRLSEMQIRCASHGPKKY